MFDTEFRTRAERRGFSAHLGQCHFFDPGTAMLIGGGLSFAGGLIQGNAANKANRRANRTMNAQLAIEDRKLALAEQQYDRWLELYDPLERDIIDGLGDGPDTQGAIDLARGDVASTYDGALERMNANLSRYGVNPNSGRFASQTGALETARATSEVGAINKARRDEEDRHFARQMAVAGMGRNLPNSAASIMGSASAGYGQAAGLQMNQAANLSADAGGFMYGAGRLLNSWADRQQGGAIPVNNGNVDFDPARFGGG